MNYLEHLENNIRAWHHDRNLIDGSTDKDQYLKLIQEAGELSDNICKGRDIADDIGADRDWETLMLFSKCSR